MSFKPLTQLEYFVCGNQAKDAQTMVLLAGWPDTAEVFRPNFIAKFGPTYRIVAVTLPGYTMSSRKEHGLPLCGWDFDTVVNSFIRTLDDAVPESQTYRRPVLVCHDWGCIITNEFLLRRPRFFERLVMLDVGGKWIGGHKARTISSLVWGQIHSMPFSMFLGIFLYQLWLIVAYVFSRLHQRTRSYGVWMASAIARRGRTPGYVRNPESSTETGVQGVVPEMGYLYVQLWWHLLMRRPLVSVSQNRDPVVPVFYGYGSRKPFHFHTKQWLINLAKRTPVDGSMAVPYEGGHWFYHNPQSTAGAQCLRDVERFLQQPKN